MVGGSIMEILDIYAYMKVISVSHSVVSDSVTPWTGARQAPLSMGFSRQEYWSDWSELPFPSPGDPPDPGIELVSPALKADSLPSEPPGKSIYWMKKWKAQISHKYLEFGINFQWWHEKWIQRLHHTWIQKVLGLTLLSFYGQWHWSKKGLMREVENEN